MKIPFKNLGCKGLTLVELLVVLTILAILAVLLLPALSKAKQHKAIPCVNNLKEIGVAFRLWAMDHDNKFPTAVSTNDGGAMEFVAVGDVFKIFQSLQNEFGTPKILACPKDAKRKAATSFPSLKNENISYFLGIDATETNTSLILSGDRNITNGFPALAGKLELTTNQMVGFTKEIHNGLGNLGFADGSVQQVSSASLRSVILPNTGLTTNRILLP